MTIATLAAAFAATLAAAFAAAFEKDTRTDGTPFYKLAEGSPEWMRDAIHAAHADMFPDDMKYRMIRQVAMAIDERLRYDSGEDLDEVKYELIGGLIPVYNKDRTAWLASHLDRAEYCNEAAEEGGADGKDIFALIAAGIERELLYIWDAVVEAFTDQAEEQEDDGEDDDDEAQPE